MTIAFGQHRDQESIRPIQEKHITWEHFPEDCCLFALRENGGTRKRGTTVGSCDEIRQVQYNVVDNFSRERAMINGHPRSKKINGLTKRAEKNVYLDTN